MNLTSEEKKELQKRGFLVRDGFGMKNLIDIFIHFLGLSTLYMAGFGFILMGIFFETQISWILYFIFTPIVFTGFSFLRAVFYYIGMGKFFYTKDYEIIFGRNIENNSYKEKIDKLYESYGKVHSIKNINGDDVVTKVLLKILMILTCIMGVIVLIQLKGLALLLITPIVGIPLIIPVIAKIYQSFNPLYAFGNLGQKIQSLTPRISEQSKQIESEFRGDMDFRVLSKSFDSLASTFSRIVNLVVKLEQVEKKANKGDLFDSAKYINSLREDIRTPLLSLKNFLESKKTELQSSQAELMRVRVSVGGESENRELQSVRTNELLKELDENIGKLGVMLERL